jgi:hypothetical protein
LPRARASAARRAVQAVASRVGSILNAVGSVLDAPRSEVTLLLAGIGCMLLLVGGLLDVGKMTVPQWACTAAMFAKAVCSPGHQVGYLYAPNWAIGSVAVWPAMFYALSSLLRHAELAFETIDGSPMAWLGGEATGARSVLATWRRHKDRLRTIAGGALVLGLLVSVAEWWGKSARSLLLGQPTIEHEIDWTALPVADSFGWHLAQAAFTLAAFLYQGIVIAMMVTFAASAILMARTTAVHASGEAAPPLLVDIESNDPAKRLGFEKFALVIDYMIVFVALAFAAFFFTRLQNAYLRDSHHRTIGEFIRQDFFVQDLKHVPDLLTVAGLDLSSTAVVIGGVLIMFQCFFFFNATLRHAALQVRNRSDHELIQEPLLGRAAASGLDRAEIRTRLRDANVWPLGYSDLMPTLSFLTLSVVTIIFYRVGIYLIFLWIGGWVIARGASGLIRRG